MLSRIVFVVAVLSLISLGSGYYFKRESVFEQTMTCLKNAWATAYKELQKGEVHEALCYYKVSSPS